MDAWQEIEGLFLYKLGSLPDLSSPFHPNPGGQLVLCPDCSQACQLLDAFLRISCGFCGCTSCARCKALYIRIPGTPAVDGISPIFSSDTFLATCSCGLTDKTVLEQQYGAAAVAYWPDNNPQQQLLLLQLLQLHGQKVLPLLSQQLLEHLQHQQPAANGVAAAAVSSWEHVHSAASKLQQKQQEEQQRPWQELSVDHKQPQQQATNEDYNQRYDSSEPGPLIPTSATADYNISCAQAPMDFDQHTAAIAAATAWERAATSIMQPQQQLQGKAEPMDIDRSPQQQQQKRKLWWQQQQRGLALQKQYHANITGNLAHNGTSHADSVLQELLSQINPAAAHQADAVELDNALFQVDLQQLLDFNGVVPAFGNEDASVAASSSQQEQQQQAATWQAQDPAAQWQEAQQLQHNWHQGLFASSEHKQQQADGRLEPGCNQLISHQQQEQQGNGLQQQQQQQQHHATPSASCAIRGYKGARMVRLDKSIAYQDSDLNLGSLLATPPATVAHLSDLGIQLEAPPHLPDEPAVLLPAEYKQGYLLWQDPDATIVKLD